jgi:hypothetical protein
MRVPLCLRDEEAAGSNPATPTIKVTQVEAAPLQARADEDDRSEAAIS